MADQTSRLQVSRDLVADLAEQRAFLRSSAAAYDAGNESEAKRLALALRILVHDTKKQRSLLSQMGVRDRITWTDTSGMGSMPRVGPEWRRIASFRAGLVVLAFGSGVASYVPYLSDPPPGRLLPPTTFAEWWTRTMMSDGRGNDFSRCDLVLAVADQDGGAHIDDRLDCAYHALTRENSLGVVAKTQHGQAPPANSPALANIRQIVWEAEDTLDRHGQAIG